MKILKSRSWIGLKIGFLAVVSCAMGWFAACGKPDGEQKLSLTVAFSNDIVGNIRSCGCLTKDYGGLGRRATFVRIVRDTSANFLLLEAGDFFGSEINYGREKAEVTMKAMALMGYHGIVLGEIDFSFGVDYILNRSRDNKLPILVANLFDTSTDTLLFSPKQEVVLSGGLKVALIGVMSERLKFPPQVKPGTVRLTDPIAAVRSQLDSIGEDTDLVVVLAHMDREEAAVLAQQLPRIDLVVNGHFSRLARKTRRTGNAFILQIARGGRNMGIAYCKLTSERRVEKLELFREPLSKKYRDDDAVAKLFAAYDMDIVAKEKSNVPSGVIAAGRNPKKPFVGAENCRECHEEYFSQWESTNHAQAFDVLVTQSREFDRDCTPCHTTGFYELGGFISLVETPELINVQCESCHGNGYDHEQNPKIHTNQNPSSACKTCHTPDWSPGFSFDERWPKISH